MNLFRKKYKVFLNKRLKNRFNPPQKKLNLRIDNQEQKISKRAKPLKGGDAKL